MSICFPQSIPRLLSDHARFFCYEYGMAEEQKKDELTVEKILKALKINVAKKIQAGEVGLASEIEKIHELERNLKRDQVKLSDHTPSDQEEDIGIPSRLRVKRRPYTMSEAARRARQDNAKSPNKSDGMRGNQNAYKHGEYAQGMVRQIFRPCKSTCEHYPCAIVEEGQTEPGEFCLDKIQFIRNLQAVQKAMRDGKLDDFKDLAAVHIAGAYEVVGKLLEDILIDGTLVKSEKFDGFGRLLGHELKNHPSLLPLSKMIESLRLTPQDFMITPLIVKKTQTDEKTAETLATAMGRAAAAARKAREGKKQ